MRKNKKELKVSSGIDTLYYFCDCNIDDYIEIYNKMQIEIKKQLGGEDLSYNAETGEITIKKQIVKDISNIAYDDLNYLGKGNGFTWFKLTDKNCDIARIGFKSYSVQEQVKNIYIQLEGASIYFYGLHKTIDIVSKSLTKIGLTPTEKFVSRIDLNIFSNISFAVLDLSWTQSKFKKGGEVFSFIEGKQYETVYFGKKGNPKIIRIYDKIKEIKQSKLSDKNKILVNKLKEDGLIKDFEIDTLWNFELELHREFLTKNYSIDTLDDMFKKIDAIWYEEIIKNFRILKKDMKYKKHLKNDKKRIPELEIFEEMKKSYVSGKLFDKGIKNKSVPYKMSKNALFNQTIELLNKYNSYQEDETKKLTIQDFASEFLEHIAISYFENQDINTFEDYKYIPVSGFDKKGLLIHQENLMKPFYEKHDNELTEKFIDGSAPQV